MPSTKQTALVILTLATLAFSLGTRLARADYLPEIYPFRSCDAAGNEKLTFALGENVYGRGGSFWPNQDVSIYIIPTLQDPTPSNAMAPPVNVTTGPDGRIPITRIWIANMIGKYAVWVDTNQNGRYDENLDKFYHFCYCYLFNVIPEYLVGTIGAVGAMIGSFALYRARSARRNRKSE